MIGYSDTKACDIEKPVDKDESSNLGQNVASFLAT